MLVHCFLFPDVHGHLNQHWSGLPPQRQREAHPVPEGPEPAQARQVGHLPANYFPAAGETGVLQWLLGKLFRSITFILIFYIYVKN